MAKLVRVQRQNWLVCGGTPDNRNTAAPSRRWGRFQVLEFTNQSEIDLMLKLPKQGDFFAF
ncbi:hypothetical protein [Allofranklinella schreckenbergeri]|uniref:hypothetical protein n=1 Tax=Allofranklinella schreckenbergeri TaxID=1076744 RepID=UPI0011C46715|nr:hypothetical protein [Allofranklinella schreckenbergeri]